MDVTVLDLPQVLLQTDTTLCPGISMNLMSFVTPLGGSYLWSSNQTTPNITVYTQGQYWLEYSTVCGTVSDTIQVDYYPDYTFTLGNDTTVCLNALVVLQPNIPINGTIEWNDGTSLPIYNSTSAELIFATVDDGNGCLQIDSLEVFNHPLIQTNLPANVSICDGSSTILDASSPQGVLYVWNINDSTATIDVDNGGTYSVEITDAFGCTLQESTDVIILSLPSPSIVGPVQYCSNEATVYSVSGNYSQYDWSSGDVSATTTISGVLNQISVVVTDINGCQGVDTLVLAAIEVPELDLGEDIVL
jgi:hypothetical protein